jgi:hypothetical protein
MPFQLAPVQTSLDPLSGGQLRTPDGTLQLSIPAGQAAATSIGVAPAPYTLQMPLPLGKLRLTDAAFTFWAADQTGAPVPQPASLVVRPPATALAATSGDLAQLTIAYVDPLLGWQAVPTLVLPDGSLTATLPVSGMVAIMRLAPSYFVQIDGERVEAFGEINGQLQVRAPGGVRWVDPLLATPVPAPDAVPPDVLARAVNAAAVATPIPSAPPA